MSFDIRDHLEQLHPHPTRKGAHQCPVCGDGPLTHNKTTGAYSCWAGCEPTHIRNAISPSCNPQVGRSAEELEQARRDAEARRKQQQQEQEQRHAAAAARAQQEWAAAVPLLEAPAELVQRCYWTRKGLQPTTDVRIVVRGDWRGWVLVPMFAMDGTTLRNVQRLHPTKSSKEGGKQNVKGAQKQGCSWLIGDPKGAKAIAIAEGPATGCSIYEATGWPTVVAFGKGNLEHAIARAKAAAPTATLVLCADNDKDGDGLKAAEPLARQYSGVMAIPPTVETDWNDHHLAEGLKAVTDALNAALAGGPVSAAEAEGSVSSTQEAQALSPRFQKRPDTQARWGKRKLSHRQRMDCLDRCVEVQALTERNTFRRRARLQKAAVDLELNKYVSRQELSQKVLTAKDRAMGNCYRALTAADRAAMEWPDVEWLIPNLLPAGDLSIIGGRPKVGKTSLALAIAAAVLTRSPVAGFSAPDKARPVLLVTDDQSDADTRDALLRLGVFDHPQLLWSRRFRLTEEDTDKLLGDIRNHPGALVIIDSLRSVSRSLTHSENDPELGAVIYDLKAVVTDAGGSLLLIHHCNKADGLIGVEALSGHSAIAGAANTVVTLHYVEGDTGKPSKEAPQRRMVREGRTGKPLDWVLTRDDTGASFSQVSTYGEWQAQAQEATAMQKREERRNETQRDILRLLEAEPCRWWTVRDVVEGLGLQWEGRGQVGAGHRVREALKTLRKDGELTHKKVGREYLHALAEPPDEPRIVLKMAQHTQHAQHPLPDRVCDVEAKTQHPQHGDGGDVPDVDVEHVEESPQHPKPSPCLDAEDVEHVEGMRGGAIAPASTSNPWGLSAEQVAIAREVVAEDPQAHPFSVELKLSSRGVAVKRRDIAGLMAWLMGGAA